MSVFYELKLVKGSGILKQVFYDSAVLGVW
jgi:hypothetical protein